MPKLNNTRDAINYSAKYISGKTLDLGAGSAKYKNIIKPHTSEYVALDMVPGNNIDIVSDVFNTPFKEGHFDTVISTQVLEHVKEPWLMVKEIKRVLKKDGLCIITAPFLIPYHADPGDYFRYTKEGLKSLFEREGFEILECEACGSFSSTISELIHFTFFSPYKKQSGKIAKRFLIYMEKTARFLDNKISRSPAYVDSYVVAKKN